MAKIIAYLRTRPPSVLEALAYVAVLGIAYVDYATGTEVSIAFFYLLPICLVAWVTGRHRGVLISAISTIVSFTADFEAQVGHLHPVISYWNATLTFGFFVIVTFLLSGLKHALESQAQLARTDFLTGVANARSFYEFASFEINRARRYRRPFSLGYFDLDNFKAINDAYGHSTGDTLLRSVANTTQNNLRRADIVARLGGDEFAILLPEADPDQADFVIRKIRGKLLEEMQRNGWPVTFSIGAVTFLQPPASVDDMIKKADGLMYSAKNSGGNAVRAEVFGGPK